MQEFMDNLEAQAETNKDARVRFNQITRHIQGLGLYGTRLGMPQTRRIEGDIWELRPTSDRIFYFCHAGKKIVLLHYFHKKTRATPRQEIEQAQRNRQSYLEGERP